MKKNIFFKYIAAGLALFAFASCNDIVNYDDGFTPAEEIANNGAPVITAVYEVTDTAYANPLTQGTVGQMVHIVGKNLNHAKSISFNGVEIDLSQVYSYSTATNVTIPLEPSQAPNDSIIYVTDKGRTSYYFPVPYPEMRVDNLYCEFINAGETATINGQNFDVYDFSENASVTIGDTPLEIDSISNTALYVKIPEGTPDNSEIAVNWTDGETGEHRSASLPFRPAKDLLFGDFSGIQESLDQLNQLVPSIEHDATGDDGSTIPALGYPHIHFTGTLDAWGWNQYAINGNIGNIDNITNIDDYVFKYEILTPNNYPITEETGIKWNFNWAAWTDWAPEGGLNTHGTWQTVSIPLSTLTTTIPTPNSWFTLSIVIQPSNQYTVDLRMANFRVQHK